MRVRPGVCCAPVFPARSRRKAAFVRDFFFGRGIGIPRRRSRNDFSVYWVRASASANMRTLTGAVGSTPGAEKRHRSDLHSNSLQPGES
jgi:hypothetical protein